MDQNDYQDPQEGEEIEIEAIGIDVSSQPIELYKVFKIANLVGGGGEAKHIISEGYVAVNGELETRKRRKMYDGDFFEFNEEYYVVVCDAPVQEAIEKVKSAPKEVKSNKTKKNKSHSETDKKSKKGKDRQHALSASAKPKEKAKSKSKPAATKVDKETPKKQRDEKSGRNSIDFF